MWKRITLLQKNLQFHPRNRWSTGFHKWANQEYPWLKHTKNFITSHMHSQESNGGANWQVEETAISINSLMIWLVKDKAWYHTQRANKYSIFSLYFAAIFTMLVQQYLDTSDIWQLPVTRCKRNLNFYFLKLLFNGTYFRTWSWQLISTKYQNMWHLTT